MGTQFGGRELKVPARAVKKTPNNARPSMYKVYLLNDDYTPMDFVVTTLQMLFGMNYPHAVTVMLEIHRQGKAVCGIYPRDIAETKVLQVNNFARMNDHPLLCRMEKCTHE